ncbi:MAG: hypothetical protein ACP5OU_06270 [Methanothrix sp.]
MGDIVSRKAKMDEFKEGGLGPHMSFFQNLTSCAYSELYLSLEDRRRGVVRLKDNHYSTHAVGSIVLLVTGFDSFLNEGLSSIGIGTRLRQILELGDKSTTEKYYGTIEELGGMIPRNNDLNVIIKLRDEIVHYFPRNVSERGPRRYLPQALNVLDKRGLLFRFPDSKDFYEVPFGELVSSYRLAYWVWQNIDIAVNELITAFSSTRLSHFDHFYSSLHSNFQSYQMITSPDNLVSYDSINEID